MTWTHLPAHLASREHGAQTAPRAKRVGRTEHVPGTMNKAEQTYAGILEFRRLAGEVREWWFELLKLRLADRCWYTPDFAVWMPDGRLEIHEVKGHMEDDAAVKLRVAAKEFPSLVFRVFRFARKSRHTEEWWTLNERREEPR